MLRGKIHKWWTKSKRQGSHAMETKAVSRDSFLQYKDCQSPCSPKSWLVSNSCRPMISSAERWDSRGSFNFFRTPRNQLSVTTWSMTRASSLSSSSVACQTLSLPSLSSGKVTFLWPMTQRLSQHPLETSTKLLYLTCSTDVRKTSESAIICNSQAMETPASNS